MRPADYPAALERAAAPVLAAIERDRRRAPRRLKPVFAAMGEDLFEPGLDLDKIAGVAGFDDALFAELGAEVGLPAWSYLRDARLETAAHLLLKTPIPIAEIGRMVGYGSVTTFRGLLRDFLGMPASRYRRQAPRILERGGSPPPGAETEEYWERMLAGELSGEEARALDDYLGRLAPESGPAAAGDDAERWRRLRAALADGFVDAIDHLRSFADQRRMARDAIWFPDGTFFERLSRQSRDSAAEDPGRAVEWALLAIDSLAANGALEGDPGRAALAWARLALARWRAGDLAGAEKDLEQSARDSGHVGAGAGAACPPRGDGSSGDCPASWQAETSRVAAACHWHQGRWRQALAFAHRAVAAQRAAGLETGDRQALAKVLRLRAELRAAVADLESPFPATRIEELRGALVDLDEARGLEVARGSPTGLRPRLLVLLGARTELAANLPAMRQAMGGDSDGNGDGDGGGRTAALLWLEGHAGTEPEARWRQARERFSALGDGLRIARAALDLARLYLSAGRPREASTRAAELGAELGALVTAPEDLAALKTLGRAATPLAGVTGGDLDRAERILKRLEWHRRASRALQLAL